MPEVPPNVRRRPRKALSIPTRTAAATARALDAPAPTAAAVELHRTKMAMTSWKRYHGPRDFPKPSAGGLGDEVSATTSARGVRPRRRGTVPAHKKAKVGAAGQR